MEILNFFIFWGVYFILLSRFNRLWFKEYYIEFLVFSFLFALVSLFLLRVVIAYFNMV